jgi:hypothetical protein
MSHRRETERLKFSKTVVAALPLPEKGRATVFDTVQAGLLCAIYPSGNRVFYWVRTCDGKAVWKRLGAFPAMSVENARIEAGKKNTALLVEQSVSTTVGGLLIARSW